MSCSPSRAAPTKNPDNEARAAWKSKMLKSHKELDPAINLLCRGDRMSDEQWRAACARIYPE